MAERNRPGNLNPTSNNASGSATTRIRAGVASASLPTARRNHFQSTTTTSSSTSSTSSRNLNASRGARRPAPGSSLGTADSMHLDAGVPSSDSSEIVVRDSRGEIELGDPPTPDLEDQEELPLDSQQESEQERQRLAEAVKHHQINSSAVPDQPEELLEAVRASLRAKVAALAEDNWMYEAEEPSRGT
ncbi:hypothetical protein ACRE_014990 [Hapsidospora chrysogenum ATCC 11550]|uniref:Uncharacterized protein n=1 Tax=Hapsidospora chrysogenum (strain ATCC 11550 / CBS 779.69 / DSM 880 / IAM 14645 / JCM 23072 / IMI 49137) TaxID=857340 RepID=A0A086TE13_HAPC1|nr:hypothetical protein ACRE_014990 [Hapsidospora chrysogenum ATCC 11550]